MGAYSPEEYGDYYAWGETEESSNYSWDTYKWCNGTEDSMTKYCVDSSYGTVDNKSTLDPEDDVAYVKWGGNWRMPTYDEIIELRTNCTWEWTTFNGVKGHMVTASNGNSIFFPTTGYRAGTDIYHAGEHSRFWSSSLGYEGMCASCILGMGEGSGYSDAYYRYLGFPVRPVCD